MYSIQPRGNFCSVPAVNRYGMNTFLDAFLFSQTDDATTNPKIYIFVTLINNQANIVTDDEDDSFVPTQNVKIMRL